jgi:hypothetical protein
LWQLLEHNIQGPILSTTDFLPWFTRPNCFANKNDELRDNPQIYIYIYFLCYKVTSVNIYNINPRSTYIDHTFCQKHKGKIRILFFAILGRKMSYRIWLWPQTKRVGGGGWTNKSNWTFVLLKCPRWMSTWNVTFQLIQNQNKRSNLSFQTQSPFMPQCLKEKKKCCCLISGTLTSTVFASYFLLVWNMINQFSLTNDVKSIQ